MCIGRRHQLRVHCAAIGHAIVGDASYGGLVGEVIPPMGGPKEQVLIDTPSKYHDSNRTVERKIPSTVDAVTSRATALDEIKRWRVFPFSQDRMMLHAHVLRYRYYVEFALFVTSLLF